MELFFQFTGPAGDALLLDREKTYMYSSPRERAIDRCGELPRGAYFACSELLYVGDHVWMKIRRGAFSTAAQASGYLRVEFDFDESLAPKQRRSAAFYATPRRFKDLVELPTFPAFLCARERVTLARTPTFDGELAPHMSHILRHLPLASVFHATERRFNADFTQLALKISSAFGFGGWISVSFADTLMEVEDPRQPLATPTLVQNIAPRTGKWMGELPVRGLPTLQAPRLGNLESFGIATAVERKLVKDHVWLRLQQFDHNQLDADTHQLDANTHQSDADTHQSDANTDAWIIERHANSAERVVVPWGADNIHADSLANDEYAQRYYRNIYGRRPLPLRKEPRLQSEIVGELAAGTVVWSTRRVLNAHGQVWVRVALSEVANANPQDVTYGYAIQSSAKTNVCMLQEISPPGKMSPKQFFQVVLTNTNTFNSHPPTPTVGVVAVRTEPSATANQLFFLKHGTVLRAIGSIYNSDQKSMWLQVLRDDMDPKMIQREEALRLPQDQQQQQEQEKEAYVMYVPLCSTDAGHEHESVVLSLGRPLVKGVDAAHHGAEQTRSVVNTGGRASKLFGSQLMRPSTIELDKPATAPANKPPPVRAARAAGEEDDDPTQALKNEINAWQNESARSTVYKGIHSTRTAVAACLQRPFASCLQRSAAAKMYSQLHQNDDEDEDEEMAYGRRRP